MRWLVSVLVAGCASGGRDMPIDASVQEDGLLHDAPTVLVDAPPGAQTLTQTTSPMLQAGVSIACSINPPGTNAANYYRVFDLPALGITNGFKVTEVTFQVEHCDQINGTAGAVVAVRVGTYAGTPGAQLEPSMMTVLASNPTVQVGEVIESGTPPMTAGETVHAPINATIPAGQKLFVEVDAPDGRNQFYLYMGANTLGESAFGYVLSPACSIANPTNISSVSSTNPAVHLLLTVTGLSGS